MTQSGKLITRLGILAMAIILSGVAITQRDTHAADNSYLAAILEKDQLIRNTPSPRVILVGGSNLAFGVDSRMLIDSLHMPVVNMGLYAKLGLKYMLAQAKPYVRKGDVIVIVPEYDQFYGDFANGDNTLNTALLYTPPDRIGDFIRSYSIIDVLVRPRVENAREAFLRTAAAAVGREDQFFPPDTNPVYNRHSFNQYGDAVSHIGKKGLDPDSIFVKPLPPMKEFNRKSLADLNDFEARAESQGAHAYFMYPSYIDRSYVINVPAIDSLAKKLSTGMRVPIVGTPRDFVYPKQYFFDTRYHLTGEGRELRTLELLKLLRSLPGIAAQE
jgi:hypothetical protein